MSENKSPSFFSRFRDKQFLKGLSTVIGSILINLICGSIFPLNSLAIYQISYIKHVNPESSITIDNLIFYYPFETFSQTLASFFSGIIEKKLGFYYTNFIGFSLLALGYFTMYLSKSFFFDILSMILGGVGNGIIYYPSTKNAVLWFPEHTGVVMGIMETMISLGSFLFAIIGEYVINGESQESEEEGEDIIYPIEVAIKVKTYLIILITSVIGVYIISSFMTFLHEEKAEEKKEDLVEKDPDDDIYNINDLISNEENKQNIKKMDFKKMFITALKSKRLHLYMAMSVCFNQAPNMLFSLFRIIGEYENIDIKILQWINSINFVFECLSGVIIGVLCDYIRLNILYAIISLSMTVLIYTYCFSFSNSLAFFFSTNIITFINGGIYPFDDCYMMKVFGSHIYIELMGINTFLSTVVFLSLSPLSYYIETSVENKHESFWILFLSFGVLNIVAFVLGLFLNPNPFDFEERMGLKKKDLNESNKSHETECYEITDDEDVDKDGDGDGDKK